MSDMGNYLEVQSFNFWFRPGVGAPTRPTSHTVSLWSAVSDPEAGTGTELTNGTAPGYARAAVTFGAYVDGVGGANNAVVNFAVNSGGSNWPTVTHYGIHDHLGNLLQRLVALPAVVVVPPGQQAVLEVGDLVILLD